jgi:hypothetical protein
MWDWLGSVGNSLGSAARGVGDWFSGVFSGGSGPEQLAGPGAGAVGSGGSWWSDALAGIGKVAQAAAPVASIGANALGAYSGMKAAEQGAKAQKLQERSWEAQQQAMAPMLRAGAGLTEAGFQGVMGGALPDGLEAQVEDWKRRSMAQLEQHMASSGQGDSSTRAQWQAYIDQQAGLYRQQLAQGLLGQGYQGLGGASTTASNAGAQAGAATQGAASAMSAAQQSLAQMLASLGKLPERK